MKARTTIASDYLPVSADSGPVSFVAVDWGTTSFRLWSLSETGDILDHVSGPFGMSGLASNDYNQVLEEQLAKLKIAAQAPVVICGMAGSAQGWLEAPYAPAPTSMCSLGEHAVQVQGVSRRVYILPGVMQLAPANVMRGEETQILGLLLSRPDYEGTVCLPGTHSKWVQVRHEKIERFTTCLTGELFALLSEQSVLRHSVAEGGWDQTAFTDAAAKVMTKPELFAESLFSVRADMLLNDQSPAVSRARLSGLLVGLELASTRDFWINSSLVFIGEPSLCESYVHALATQSVSAEIVDNVAMTLGGLVSAYRQIGANEN